MTMMLNTTEILLLILIMAMCVVVFGIWMTGFEAALLKYANKTALVIVKHSKTLIAKLMKHWFNYTLTKLP